MANLNYNISIPILYVSGQLAQQKTRWHTIGKMTVWENGNMSLQIDSIPNNWDGRAQLFKQEYRDQQQPQSQPVESAQPVQSSEPMLNNNNNGNGQANAGARGAGGGVVNPFAL
jgi:hypothetical protein